MKEVIYKMETFEHVSYTHLYTDNRGNTLYRAYINKQGQVYKSKKVMGQQPATVFVTMLHEICVFALDAKQARFLAEVALHKSRWIRARYADIHAQPTSYMAMQ